MQILSGELIRNETNQNSKGGTELLGERLASIGKEYLEDYQIIFSRQRELDESKIRIFYAHDLAADPEADNALANGKWQNYHKIIFVSNWQMQKYIDRYQIPYSHCLVFANSILPIPKHEKPRDVIRLGYWSTPHRGLQLLVPVFKALCKKYDNIELDVFSSFNLYGWGERDKQFAEIIQNCIDDPKINYHGTKSNSEIRSALEKIHILAYPSIWPETSCLVLMEAMSAGCVCVHSNFAALYETAANWTQMYQFDEDPNRHAHAFYANLDLAIENLNNETVQSQLAIQKSYADVFYNWDIRANQWKALLKNGFKDITDRSLPKKQEYFSISV